MYCAICFYIRDMNTTVLSYEENSTLMFKPTKDDISGCQFI